MYFKEKSSLFRTHLKITSNIHVFKTSCFTKNEPASGCFWAVSLKAYAFKKMLTASKICSFLVDKIPLILLHNVKGNFFPLPLLTNYLNLYNKLKFDVYAGYLKNLFILSRVDISHFFTHC